MSQDDAFSQVDASIGARQRSNSVKRLRQDDIQAPDSGKRRKMEGNVEDLLGETFTVKPHPSTTSDRPRSFRPIALLPRSQLPLSFLDINSVTNALPDCRLFQAHVKILELEQRMGTTLMVLIARLDDGKTYAVERESQGLYVVCKLGSWVDMSSIYESAVVSKPLPRTAREEMKYLNLPISADENSQITAESIKYQKKKRLAIEAIQSMVKRPSGGLLGTQNQKEMQNSQTDSQLDFKVDSQIESQVELNMQEAETQKAEDDAVTQPGSGELLDNIRTQYFETLYLSKASLGYFAKGPLSRARAAFHLDCDATLEMNDLIDFLGTLALSTTVLDKKYKDGVAEVINDIDLGKSADEASKSRRKRKPKKMKPGKNGLYPMEEDLLRQWWESQDADADPSGETLDDKAKRRINQLRIRETQLQMIVILEALALLPLASHNDADETLPSATAKESQPGDKESRKLKKPRDLSELLEIHVDRLCIWQSVAAEGRPTTSTKHDSTSQMTSSAPQKVAADVLREFCTEVIVPFFASRLPKQCDAISRKLGGPVAMTPGRPKLAKSASTSGILSRPGAVTKRNVSAPSRPTRSLRRVLTDERHSRSNSRGPLGAISLMRSATAPSVPGLKRESSEVPSLGSIPAAESQMVTASRGGVLKSKKFSHREVDLSNLGGRDKKNTIATELQEAISALKRPNRLLAGQTIMETSERRTSSILTSSKKSKKPVRNPLFNSVQITATPNATRHKDMIGSVQSLPAYNRNNNPGPYLNPSPDIIPASSAIRIPQSAIRPAYSNSRDFQETPLANSTPTRISSKIKGTPTVDETPSRQPGNRAQDFGRMMPSSPLMPRNSNIMQFLSVPTSTTGNSRDIALSVSNTTKLSDMVFSTPVKTVKTFGRQETEAICPDTGRGIERVVQDDQFARGMQGSGSEAPKLVMNDDGDDSFYKSLGWDNDMDDLL